MRIPNTDSIHVLADFWDTHSVTDFDDQIEEVGEPDHRIRLTFNDASERTS